MLNKTCKDDFVAWKNLATRMNINVGQFFREEEFLVAT
jgi:hypothetical protein